MIAMGIQGNVKRQRSKEISILRRTGFYITKTLTLEVGLEDSDILSRSVLSDDLLGHESEKSGDGSLDEHCGGNGVSRYGFVGYSGM
jgi:hypothetical protein